MTIIALGLLSLSSITLRGSDAGKAQSTARANARLALMVAIGELQKSVGPDTRATAPAGQLKNGAVPNPDWVAAYSTRVTATKEPVVGHANGASGADPNWSTDIRTTQTNWRDLQRIGYLVSGVQPDATLATPVNSVVLAKLTSADGTTTRSVSAPKVEVNAATPGNYAWWVSDESTKARLDLAPLTTTDKPQLAKPATLAALQGPSRHNAFKTPGFEWQSTLTATDAPKLVSLNSSQVLQPDATKAKEMPKRLGDFTTVSMSVLSNPLYGGLKKDLGAYLSNTASSVNIDLTTYKLGQLADATPMIPGDRYNRGGGPVMGMLRGWSMLGEDVRTSSPASASPTSMTVTPRFPAGRASSRASADYAQEGAAPALTGDKLAQVMLPTGSTTTGMPIHPVMTEARYSLDFVYENAGGTTKVIPLIYPRVVIWNPYNVKLAAASYVVVLPLRMTNDAVGVTYTDAAGVAQTKSMSFNSLVNPTVGGDWRKQYFCFTISAETFNPGECKVYTPDIAAANAPVLGSVAGCYSGSDISKNKLTAKASNSLGGAFYVPSNVTVPADASNDGAAKIKFTQQTLFQAENWLLKGATGSLAISSANLLASGSSGAAFPTLQAYYSGLAGLQAYQAGVDEFSNAFSGGTMKFRSASSLTKNIQAPAQVSRAGRWINFQDAGNTGAWINSAWAADFNPRAAVNCRYPLSYSGPYYTRTSTPWTAVQPTRSLLDLQSATGSNGTSWIASPFWSPLDSPALPPRVVFYDVPHPVTPLISIGRLRHATLSRYMWHPNYTIGYSQISHLAECDASANRIVAAKSTTDQWTPLWTDNRQRALFDDIIDSSNISANQNLIYDLAFEVNNTIFDDYFLSGLPRSTAGETTSWNATKPTGNPLLTPNPYAPQATLTELTTTSPVAEVLDPAALLFLKGGFNANSTSLASWKAVLYSMRDLSRPLATGTSTRASYARVTAPWLDGRPTYEYDDRVFQGFAGLDDTAIDKLATAIIAEVKLRGPFLTLGDFVNRRMSSTAVDSGAGGGYSRPTSPGALLSRMGALDSAIEQSGVNSGPQNNSMEQNLQYTSRDPYTNGTTTTHRVQHQSSYKNAGMPGILTQGDLLESLGATLTTRGDTFLIRAYGEARESSPNGKLLATAWCEAVVQRTPQYLISNDNPLTATGTTAGNRPFDPAFIEEWLAVPSSTAKYRSGKSAANPSLDPLNERFGRRFVVTSFRWLTQAEVNGLS